MCAGSTRWNLYQRRGLILARHVEHYVIMLVSGTGLRVADMSTRLSWQGCSPLSQAVSGVAPTRYADLAVHPLRIRGQFHGTMPDRFSTTRALEKKAKMCRGWSIRTRSTARSLSLRSVSSLRRVASGSLTVETRAISNFEAYVQHLLADQGQPPTRTDRVPASVLWLVDDGAYLSRLNLPHRLNRHLRRLAGPRRL